MTRVLLDLTTAFVWRGRKAVGIVRTERELGIRLLDDESLCLLPFIFQAGKMRAVDRGFARLLLTEDEDEGAWTTAEAAVPPPQAERSSLAALIRPAGATARFVARNVLRAVPDHVRPDAKLSLLHMREAARRLVYGLPPAPPPPPPPPRARPEPDLSLVVNPRRDDTIWTCGLGWEHFDWSPIAAVKARVGFRI